MSGLTELGDELPISSTQGPRFIDLVTTPGTISGHGIKNNVSVVVATAETTQIKERVN